MVLKHGTANAYNNHGCRCQECRDAWAEACRARKSERKCSICDEPFYARDLCKAHYARLRRGLPLDTSITRRPKARKKREKHPDRWTIDEGYVMVRTDTGPRLEHRVVMENVLGRPLVYDETMRETVHHKNGVRSDNRPSNLELRVSYHPPGQTPDDLVDWAHEVIERYS